MKAKLTLSKAQVEEALNEWAKLKGLKISGDFLYEIQETQTFGKLGDLASISFDVEVGAPAGPVMRSSLHQNEFIGKKEDLSWCSCHDKSAHHHNCPNR